MLVVTKGDIEIKVSEHPFGMNWWTDIYPTWEQNTFKVFDRFLDSSMEYLDLGFYLGQTIIYAAHKVKNAYGIDLDLVAYNAGIKNINCNNLKNVKTKMCAISDKKGYVSLQGVQGGSSRRIVEKHQQQEQNFVQSLTLQDLSDLWGVNKFDFIKIDIEGAEEFVLPSIVEYCRDKKPIIWLSIHKHYGATSKTIGDFIRSCNYRAYSVSESGLEKDITANVEECIDKGPSGFGNDLLLKCD
jgi:FkbM family methyltransferase